MSEQPIEHLPPPPPDTAPSPSTDPDQPNATSDEVDTANRLFGGFALGVMALLLLCAILVLIASQRMPAGL
jgi:hypothetical protein